MDNSDSNTNFLPPLVRNKKNLLYKGKKYEVDFDLLLKYSEYFFKNKDHYEKILDIKLPEESIEIDEDVFQNFVNCCQSKPFSLNISNVRGIRILSYRYEILGLIDYINQYISEKREIATEISLHNIIQNDILPYKQDDEKIIAKSFFKIIDEENMMKIPVPILYRIIACYHLDVNNLDEQKQIQFINFLFKYLKVHPKKATILFQSIDIFNLKFSIIPFLKENEDIIDFNMIKSESLFKILNQSLDNIEITKSDFMNKNSDATHLIKRNVIKFNEKIDGFLESFNNKIEINKFDEFKFKINKIIEYYRNEKNSFKNEIHSLKENINSMNIEISNQKETIQNQENEKNDLKYEKEKLNHIISNFSIQDFITQEENISKFNDFNGKAQFFFMSKIIEKQNKNKLIQNIFSLLSFISKEQKKANYLNDANNNILIHTKQNNDDFQTLKEIETIGISFNVIETLYNNGTLESNEFIKLINSFENIYAEIEYPHNFEAIHYRLSEIKKSKCKHLKIGLCINEFLYGNYQYFQDDKKDIFCIRINTKEIDSGGAGNGRFERCKSLEKLIITNSVEKIGDGSFCDCTNLKYISLGNSLKNIGISAFNSCSKLTHVSFPLFINNANKAFEKCEKLKSIEIDPYKQNFQSDTFNMCNSIDTLIISSSHTYTESLPTKFSNIKEIIIPDSIEIIRSQSFKNCSNLEVIKIGSSVSLIGKEAFFGCSSLKQIAIPDSVQTIGDLAFSKCKLLEQVTFSPKSSLTEMGIGAFSECSSLEKITIPQSITMYKSNLFKNCKSLKRIEILNSVKVIGQSCFENCSSISYIFISRSVTEIGKNCFENCKSLSHIFFEYESSLISIKPSCFSMCTSIKEIAIPAGVKTIETFAFNGCSSLKKIKFPSSLVSIGEYAFNDCSSLRKIKIPLSTKSMAINSFLGCSSLSNVSASSEIIKNFYELGKSVNDKNVKYQFFKIAADNDNDLAMNSLACLLSDSKSSLLNYKEAIKYYKMAIDKKNGDSANSYGCMLWSGEGVDKNINEAVKYFELSAKWENGCGLRNYGICFEFGNGGLQKDVKKALSYYKLALKHGYKEAQKDIDRLKPFDDEQNDE